MKSGTKSSIKVRSLSKRRCTDFVRSTGRRSKGQELVANPGCYTTCSILTVYPLAKEGLIDMNTLIIDAKSGTSGAGRGAKVDNLYCEVNENIKAYGVASHRHTPEIEEQLRYAAKET